jgi:hypothetical protein
MRKSGLVLAMLFSIVVVTGVFARSVPKDIPVKVQVNGKNANLRPAAFQRGNQVYLPLEAIAKGLKATVKLDKAKKAYIVTAGSRVTAISESQVIKVNGTVMAPLGQVSGALGCNAQWNKSAHTVSLTARTAAPAAPAAKPAGGG